MEGIQKPFNVYFMMIIGILSVSFSAIFIRSATAPANIIAMYRMGITFLLFLPVILMKKTEEIKELKRMEMIGCMLSGIFLALHFITWITSLQYTTIASSTVLVSLQPLFTVVVAYILYREKLHKRGFVGMSIAIFGSSLMGLVNFHSNQGSLYGDILAFSGALFGALYVTIGRGMRKKLSIETYCFIVYGICALFLFAVNVVLQIPMTGYPFKDYILFLCMAIICTIGGHTVFNWALKYVEASKISTVMLGEPVGATILAILILGEIPDTGQILSGIIILTGLYLLIGSTMKEKKREKLKIE